MYVIPCCIVRSVCTDRSVCTLCSVCDICTACSIFVSQLLDHLLHIKPISTTPYYAQMDGLVERFNQTLKAVLGRTAREEGIDWDKLLPYLLFAYQEVPQSSTRFSPFYGRPVRDPLDVLKEEWESSKRSSDSCGVLCAAG